MNRFSDTTRGLLAELEQRSRGPGGPPGKTDTSTVTGRWTPTIRKIADPREDVEDLVAAMDDEVVHGSGVASWLHKNRERRSMPDGMVLMDGRPCCIRTALEVERRLPLLRMPFQFTCDNCGSVFEIVSTMR